MKISPTALSFLTRPWLVTVILFQSLSWILRSFTPPMTAFDGEVYLAGMVLGVLVAYWIELLGRFLPLSARYVVSGCIALTLPLICMANYYLYLQFGEFLSLYMLTFIWNDPYYFVNYLQTYLLTFNLVWFLLAVVLLFFLWHPRRLTMMSGRRMRHGILLLSLIIPILVVLNFVRNRNEGKFISMDAASTLAVKNFYKYLSSPNELYAAKHDEVEALPKSELPDFNVVLIFNESWGKKGLSFYGSKDTAMPFMQQWIEEERKNFFMYPHAFSQSGATDVSVPSLLTGVAPYEPNEKLHRAPFIWDWAQATGMRTIFVSSFRYGWGHFDRFFFSPGPDIHITAEDIPSPTINDSGIDDLIAIEYFIDTIQKTPRNKPFFAIFNSNALHAPYQQTSDKLAVQPSFSSRYENGQYILDASFRRLVKALKESHQLERTFFLFTADHCDTDSLVHAMPRIYSYYDEILCIPFLIRIPPAWHRERPDIVKNLRENLSRNVANLDIVPTVASLLGFFQNNNRYAQRANFQGYSLVQQIPEERMIIALNTNDVRQWNHEGFGIVWKNSRAVISEDEKIRYFDIGKDPFQRLNVWQQISDGERATILKTVQAIPHLKRIYEKL